jgi:rubrerythrin
MSELRGSQTEKNLLKAFEGESKARTRYDFFARYAKLNGHEDIAKIFEELSNNEKAHALVWLKWLCDNKNSSTLNNIKTAIAAENYENSTMYPEFVQTARKEGHEDLAELFEHVQKIEKSHEDKLKTLMEMLQNKDVTPDKNGEYRWKCSVCGCIIEQKEKPTSCPLCAEPEVFFYKIH